MPPLWPPPRYHVSKIVFTEKYLKGLDERARLVPLFLSLR